MLAYPLASNPCSEATSALNPAPEVLTLIKLKRRRSPLKEGAAPPKIQSSSPLSILVRTATASKVVSAATVAAAAFGFFLGSCNVRM